MHEPPICPDQHAAFLSFVTAREEEGRCRFREFAMAANDAAEARAVEMLLKTLVEDEYACSFREAERAAHEEANTAREIASSRLLADAFYRAAQAQELERLSREAAMQDAAEERELAARELQAEQAAEAELAARTKQDLRAA